MLTVLQASEICSSNLSRPPIQTRSSFKAPHKFYRQTSYFITVKYHILRFLPVYCQVIKSKPFINRIRVTFNGSKNIIYRFGRSINCGMLSVDRKFAHRQKGKLLINATEVINEYTVQTEIYLYKTACRRLVARLQMASHKLVESLSQACSRLVKGQPSKIQQNFCKLAAGL